MQNKGRKVWLRLSRRDLDRTKKNSVTIFNVASFMPSKYSVVVVFNSGEQQFFGAPKL